MNFLKRKGPPSAVDEESLRFVYFICNREIDWHRDPGCPNLDMPPHNRVVCAEIRYGTEGKRRHFVLHEGNCAEAYRARRSDLQQQLLSEDRALRESEKQQRWN